MNPWIHKSDYEKEDKVSWVSKTISHMDWILDSIWLVPWFLGTNFHKLLLFKGIEYFFIFLSNEKEVTLKTLSTFFTIIYFQTILISCSHRKPLVSFPHFFLEIALHSILQTFFSFSPQNFTSSSFVWFFKFSNTTTITSNHSI